jgi:hypothetical protein
MLDAVVVKLDIPVIDAADAVVATATIPVATDAVRCCGRDRAYS